MNLINKLQPGAVLTNPMLREIFRCGLQGGMRRSHRTNTLILVSDQGKGIYRDRWEGGVFHYTGMGLEGDQDLNHAQNRTLAQSQHNGIEIHLFEVFLKGQYTYQGCVKMADEPYQENQLDIHQNVRKVWMFPLELESGKHPVVIPEKAYTENQKRREKSTKHLSNGDLLVRLAHSRKIPGTRETMSRQHDRNEYIIELVKRRAGGNCQLCNKSAPFKNNNGEPFLEVHHIVWLSKNGEDSLDNTVALCPNCHRKLHVLDRAEDKALLMKKAKSICST